MHTGRSDVLTSQDYLEANLAGVQALKKQVCVVLVQNRIILESHLTARGIPV